MMKYTVYEGGQFKIRKEIEADSKEEAKLKFEDWKYNGDIPSEVELDRIDTEIQEC